MPADLSDISRCIAAEAAAIEKFVELLEHEQGALTRGETDELAALAEQKEALAVRLNELSRTRNALLATEGIAADRVGMEIWLDKNANQKAVAEGWNTVLSLAAKARELNQLNGELIRIRMQFNSEALEILLRRQNSLDLYGPDGLAKTQDGRRINDAV